MVKKVSALVMAFLLATVCCVAFVGCSSASSSSGLKHGELLEETANDGVVVLKTKIKPSSSNKATVDQNYYNIEDYVANNDMEGISEIQYWAVADMDGGEEEKVLSFTVPAELIAKIQSGEIPTNQLGDFVSDLWVHQSLVS